MKAAIVDIGFCPLMHSFINYSSMYGKSTKLFSEHISRDSLQSPATVKKHDDSHKYLLRVELMAGVGNLFDTKYHLEFFLSITVAHDLFP